MHFLTQTLVAAAFLAGAVFSVPQGVPPNGSGGGDQSTVRFISFFFPLFRSPSNSFFSLTSLNTLFLSSTQAEFAKLTKRQCYWNCCEYDPSTFGTLCRNNEAPYPYGVDCYPALDAANMTCCHQTDCQDQTYFTTPIVVI
ncbi:hypothetical protein H4I95_08903 [Botrytis cinerea]